MGSPVDYWMGPPEARFCIVGNQEGFSVAPSEREVPVCFPGEFMVWPCPTASLLTPPESAYAAVSSAGVKIQDGRKERIKGKKKKNPHKTNYVTGKRMQGGGTRIARSKVIAFFLGRACSSQA